MGAPAGNQNAISNKGGGRRSAYQEAESALWHSEKWEIDSDVPSLQAKLKSGKYSVRDVFLAKALQGNEKILGIFANKLLPDLHDVRTTGSLTLEALTEERKKAVKEIFKNADA